MNLRAGTIRARTRIWLARLRFNHALTAPGATPAIEESAKTPRETWPGAILGWLARSTHKAPAQGLPSAERDDGIIVLADVFRHRIGLAPQGHPRGIDRQPIECRAV